MHMMHLKRSHHRRNDFEEVPTTDRRVRIAFTSWRVRSAVTGSARRTAVRTNMRWQSQRRVGSAYESWKVVMAGGRAGRLADRQASLKNELAVMLHGRHYRVLNRCIRRWHHLSSDHSNRANHHERLKFHLSSALQQLLIRTRTRYLNVHYGAWVHSVALRQRFGWLHVAIARRRATLEIRRAFIHWSAKTRKVLSVVVRQKSEDVVQLQSLLAAAKAEKLAIDLEWQQKHDAVIKDLHGRVQGTLDAHWQQEERQQSLVAVIGSANAEILGLRSMLVESETRAAADSCELDRSRGLQNSMQEQMHRTGAKLNLLEQEGARLRAFVSAAKQAATLEKAALEGRLRESEDGCAAVSAELGQSKSSLAAAEGALRQAAVETEAAEASNTKLESRVAALAADLRESEDGCAAVSAELGQSKTSLAAAEGALRQAGMGAMQESARLQGLVECLEQRSHGAEKSAEDRHRAVLAVASSSMDDLLELGQMSKRHQLRHAFLLWQINASEQIQNDQQDRLNTSGHQLMLEYDHNRELWSQKMAEQNNEMDSMSKEADALREELGRVEAAGAAAQREFDERNGVLSADLDQAKREGSVAARACESAEGEIAGLQRELAELMAAAVGTRDRTLAQEFQVVELADSARTLQAQLLQQQVLSMDVKRDLVSQLELQDLAALEARQHAEATAEECAALRTKLAASAAAGRVLEQTAVHFKRVRFRHSVLAGAACG